MISGITLGAFSDELSSIFKLGGAPASAFGLFADAQKALKAGKKTMMPRPTPSMAKTPEYKFGPLLKD